jgi:tRNA U34 5-carboxymethylaminomethyl modifying GTPase MnmE/TrmE
MLPTVGGTWERSANPLRPKRMSLAYTLGYYKASFEGLGGYADPSQFTMQRTSGDERHRVVLSGIAPEAGEALRWAIEQALVPRVSTDGSADVLANVRQRDLVARARGSAAAAIDALDRGDSPEYAATHVDDALAAMGDLAGETTAEDVLRKIFETFCIGK